MDEQEVTTAVVDRLTPEDRAVYDAFVAITCPVERSRAITAWGRLRGNLRQPFRDLRIEALRQARADAERNRHKLAGLARRIGFSPTRFTRLTRHLTSEEVAS